MKLSWLRALGGFFLAAILSSPAWGMNSPQPGTINYFDGQAQVGTAALNSTSIGTTDLRMGQSLTTEKGKAEILLTPGVFLRVGDNSAVKMISPDLSDTEVRVVSGHAMVEIDEIHKENDIRVLEDGASVRLLKTGLYDFDIPEAAVRVFKGEALVSEGEQHAKLGGGRQVLLNAAGNVEPQKFDKGQFEGDLYRFSKLRSDDLAEASTQASQMYASYGWWYGPGWYGADPWLDGFTFFPGADVLYSPFGFGFYSPFAFGVPVFVHRHFEPDFDDHRSFYGGRSAEGPHGFDGHPNVTHGVAPHPGRGFTMGRPGAIRSIGPGFRGGG